MLGRKVTAQVWVGLEADAVIEGEASTEGDASLQLGLSADPNGGFSKKSSVTKKVRWLAIVVDADAYTDTI
jgi:hypothetical protein